MRKLWVVLAKYFALAFLVGLTWNGLKSNPPIAAMACGIIVAIFISYAMGMFQRKPEEPPKEQQRKQNNAAQQEIYDRHMQVIGESLDLVKTSKNMDTRISRMDVAISTLESLIAHFDDIQELKEWHAALVDFHRPALHREKLEDAVEKHMIRARAVTTLKAKISNAEKALIEFSVGDKVVINKISDCFVSFRDKNVKVGDVATVTMVVNESKLNVLLENHNWVRDWWFSKSDISFRCNHQKHTLFRSLQYST